MPSRSPLLYTLVLLLFVPAFAQAQRPELIVQAGHTDGVKSVAFSPDGRTIVTASDDRTVKLWEAGTGRLIRNFEGHAGGVERAVFSPDGRLVASVSNDEPSDVRLWDVGTGQPVRVLAPGAKNRFGAALAFSPDGKRLATTGDSLVVWDVATGGQLLKFGEYVMSVLFSPDGKMIAGCTVDKKIVLWDAAGRPLRTLEADAIQRPETISFSPDGKTLAVMTYEGAADLWDVATGRVLRSLNAPGYNDSHEAIAFSPDGRQLFVSNATHRGTIERSLDLWDVAGGKLARRIDVKRADRGYEMYADSVSFSPDGKTFVTGGHTQIFLWDVGTGERIREYRTPLVGSSGKQVTALAVNAERKTVLVLTEEATKLWDANTGLVCTLPGGYALRPPSTHSPDGKSIVLRRSSNLTITLWDADNCRELGNFDDDRLVFSPGGKVIAERDTGKSVKLYDARTLQLLRTLRGHTGAVGAVAFSRDGRLLASGSQDKTVMLWDWDTGQSLRTFEGHTGTVAVVAFSPDGKVLASGGDDGTVRLWEAASGRLLQTLAGHAPRSVSAVAFSPDGKALATGADDETVRLWDARGGKLLHELKGQRGAVRFVGFSPDGRSVVARSENSDGAAVRLWQAATGKLLLDLQEPEVKSVSFSRDGRALLVAAGLAYRDTRTRIYGAAGGELLADVIGFTNGTWIVITPSGLFDGTPEAWNQIAWRFAPNQVAPVEIFFNEFYYPGLLGELLDGKTPRARRDISQLDRRQPRLRVLPAAAPDAAGDGGVTARDLRLKIEVDAAPAGAQDVRLFRNGSLVRAWRGDVLKGRPAATLEATVPVVAGENRFTAYAFNRDQIKSADATLAVKGADSLKRKGVAYALAVGVNEYANPQYNLRYAVADAAVFAAEFKSQQEKLGQYERVEVLPLSDRQATKANVLRALEQLRAKAQPEDAVVVFFAGHGTAHANQFYLIPHDLGYAGARDNIGQAGLDAVLAHSISDRELEQAFEGVDAGQLLLVIDACNSGQALEAEEKRRGPMNSKGLAQLAYEKGMYVLTAAQSFQAAQEAQQLGHGLLTYALVEEGLKRALADAEPKDGDILAREWMNYATGRVPEMQLEKMKEGAQRGVALAFVDGEEAVADPELRSVQRPRVFYRREPEAQPLVVAKP